VENFLNKSSHGISTAVYVQKLNRIYLFGGIKPVGHDYNFREYNNSIWFIDLPIHPPPPSPPSPPNTSISGLLNATAETPPPTTTSLPDLLNCSNFAGGNYTHPNVPSNFIICRNGTQSGVFSCPAHLLFDPKLLACNVPEYVIPNLSCVDKLGPSAYPSDSTKFIVCRRYNSLVDVYDSPKPLHYDPKTRVCTLVELIGLVG
jgi:hypothetical protein